MIGASLENRKKEFAEALKQKRREAGHTQRSMAEKTGINVKTYAAYEEGRSMPKHETLARLCMTLDILGFDPYVDGFLTSRDKMRKAIARRFPKKRNHGITTALRNLRRAADNIDKAIKALQ